MYKIIGAMALAIALAACSGGGDENSAAKESMEKAGEAMKEAGEAAGDAAGKAGEAAGHAADAAKKAVAGEEPADH
jgi:hypothetical protein